MLADIEATASESAVLLRGTELAADPRLRGCLEQCRVVWKVMPPERLAQVEALRRRAEARAQRPIAEVLEHGPMQPQAGASEEAKQPLTCGQFAVQHLDGGEVKAQKPQCEIVIDFVAGLITIETRKPQRRVVRPALKRALEKARARVADWRGIRATTQASAECRHGVVDSCQNRELFEGMFVLFRGASAMA